MAKKVTRTKMVTSLTEIAQVLNELQTLVTEWNTAIGPHMRPMPPPPPRYVHNKRGRVIGRRADPVSPISQAADERLWFDSEHRRIEQEARIPERINTARARLVQLGGHKIPRDYLHQDALRFFAKAIGNRRANSLGEAINLYETELHRRRLEENQRELIAEQRHTAQAQIICSVLDSWNASREQERTRREVREGQERLFQAFSQEQQATRGAVRDEFRRTRGEW